MRYLREGLHIRQGKRLYWILWVSIFLTSIIFVLPVSSQQIYKVTQSGNSLLVKGDSNLHEWETKGQQITGELSAMVEAGSLKKIDKVSVKIQVTSLKSGKGTMDSKAYEALKSDKSPAITYQSSSFNLIHNEIISTGKLTIPGVTKDKTLKASYVIGADSKITVKGSIKLKMTEFGMELPTAILGTLKVRDDVEIIFDVSFK